MKADSDECCVLPCLSLAQANRQIRAEFLSICMKAAVTIAWRDLPKYLDTFYPTVKGQLQNVKQAPSEITIIADYNRKYGETIEIDLLPLIKMRRAHATFQCHFVHMVPGESLYSDHEKVERESRQNWLEADSEMVVSLLNHTQGRWLQDISAGKVGKILIDCVGTADEPTAQFHIHADEVLDSSEEVCWIHADDGGQTMEQYLQAMELNGIRSAIVAFDYFEMRFIYFRGERFPSVEDDTSTGKCG
jgi:hypothetical protein